MEYNLNEIQRLISSALADDGLQDLCFSSFRPVYEQFTTGQTKGDRVRKLLEYADRQREIPKLLNAIAEINPSAYAEFEFCLALNGTELRVPPSVDELVQEMRQRVESDIQERCGTMRVLDVSEPINLENIYTRVNILKTISGRRRLELTQLLQEISSEDFDRITLGGVQEKRVLGSEAVQKFSKLMLLEHISK